MKITDVPSKQPVPFGINGSRTAILATTPSGDNSASYDAGFPPVTMLLKSAGGKPPKGRNMNQILYELALSERWTAAGGGYQFDSSFSGGVSGYPQGAVLLSSDTAGCWINTVDDNTVNPEASATVVTGWLPAYFNGTSVISGISGSSVTLTTLQAAREFITLTGTLTASINLILPAWVKNWTILNNCTGLFNITCKTPSGSGVVIPSGVASVVRGDGVNIVQDGNSGRYLGTKTFYSSGTYTPSAGVKTIRVFVTGGGGSGGGCQGSSTSQTISGAGGGAGGTAIKTMAVSQSQTYPVVVGAGGNQVAGANPGLSGSPSSFAGTVIGGGGGFAGKNGATSTSGGFGGTASGGDQNISGGDGGDGQNLQFLITGNGGASYYGGGGRAGSGGGSTGQAYGSGGGGAYDGALTGNQYTSGAGRYGIVIIEEYS